MPAPAKGLERVETIRQRQIEAANRQIDCLVYQPYGLTTEEIKRVQP